MQYLLTEATYKAAAQDIPAEVHETWLGVDGKLFRCVLVRNS